MDIFTCFPEYSELATKIAAQTDAPVLAVDADEVNGMEVGDLLENRDDSRLYKVAEIEQSPEDKDILFVKISDEFEIGATQFNESMHKLAQMEDGEHRHRMADALMAHALKQASPDHAWGVREYEGIGKWYA